MSRTLELWDYHSGTRKQACGKERGDETKKRARTNKKRHGGFPKIRGALFRGIPLRGFHSIFMYKTGTPIFFRRCSALRHHRVCRGSALLPETLNPKPQGGWIVHRFLFAVAVGEMDREMARLGQKNG